MIYITGDTHIPSDINKLSSKRFPEQKEMTPKDYLIICGDFGGIWRGDNEEKYWLKWLGEKNFTTLFIDGNHENFDMLKEYPETDFFGGKAHKISDKIYHLMRGQIFEIDGKKIFTLGGASSHDKEYRTEGKSWWKEELPFEKELETATENLALHGNKVDFVITHSAPSSIQRTIKPNYEENILTDYLDALKEKLTYKKWFFGHYHIDSQIDEKHFAIFDFIVSITNG